MPSPRHVKKAVLPAGKWGVFGENDSTKPFTAYYDAIVMIRAV